MDKYPPNTREQHMLREAIDYKQQDIRGMDFKRRTFDVIIDKGTMDAIDCGVPQGQRQDVAKSRKSGNPSNYADNFEEVVAICSRMHTILKPGGLFIMITSRSITKRIEFVDELKTSHKRMFKKVYGEPVRTQLRDWRDGDARTPKMIILQAIKGRK